MKNRITNIIIVMAIMALTSCVREELLSSSRNGEEGESVKVELSFKIPPASSPQELQSRSMSTDNAFSVEFFKEASLTKTGRVRWQSYIICGYFSFIVTAPYMVRPSKYPTR